MFTRPKADFTSPDVLTLLERDLLDASWRSHPDASVRIPRGEHMGVHVRPFALIEWGGTPEGFAARQLAAYELGTLRARVFTINEAGRKVRAELLAEGKIRDTPRDATRPAHDCSPRTP